MGVLQIGALTVGLDKAVLPQQAPDFASFARNTIEGVVEKQSANAVLLESSIIGIGFRAVFDRPARGGGGVAAVGDGTPDFLRVIAAEDERIKLGRGDVAARKRLFLREFLRSRVRFDDDAIGAVADVLVEILGLMTTKGRGESKL